MMHINMKRIGLYGVRFVHFFIFPKASKSGGALPTPPPILDIWFSRPSLLNEQFHRTLVFPDGEASCLLTRSATELTSDSWPEVRASNPRLVGSGLNRSYFQLRENHF
jgi:hypothetical protein